MGIEMILHKEGGFDFTLKKIHYKKKFKWAILNLMQPYESLKKNITLYETLMYSKWKPIWKHN